jgi:hypothetical protein
MPDITVFKMEIDDSTFNAPFGGRTRSDGAETTDESSGLNVKLVAGLGAVFLLTGAALAFLLKRRFGSNEDDEDGEEDDDEVMNIGSDETDEEDEQEKGGIRAIIGLSFLIVSTAVVKRKIRVGSETTYRTGRNRAPQE